MASILIFGDSITQGFYDKGGGWADRIKKLCIRKTLDSGFQRYFEVFNLGRSGDTTEELLRRIDNELKVRVWKDPITVIIYAIGINDSAYFTDRNVNYVDKTDFLENLREIHSVSCKYTDQVCFLGLTLVDKAKISPDPHFPSITYTNEQIKKYNDLIDSFCKEHKLDFIDILNIFQGTNYKKLLSDGLHPNTKGHELIFKEVEEYLERKNTFSSLYPYSRTR